VKSRSFVVAGALAVAGAASAMPAQAATLVTDLPCYVEQQPMSIGGQGFAPGSDYTVAGGDGQIFAFGTSDPAGNWLSQTEVAPIIPERTTKPKTFSLEAKQDGVPVATTTFQAVNLMITLASTRGKPTSKTTWRFSGFEPGKSIYAHVRRGGRTLSNVRMGRGSAPCGTLATKQRRLPGVSSRRVKFGSYDIYVDNRQTFKRGAPRQIRSTLTVYRTFR